MKVSRLLRWVMVIALFGGFCIGCGGGSSDDDGGCNCDRTPTLEESGLTLSLANQEEKTPANVSVLFKVETENGNPLTDLEAGDFKIFEDGSLISEYESQQAILPKPGKFKSNTLLLLDLSGSVLESDSLSVLRNAVRSFVNEMMPAEEAENYEEIEMGIWWFDGASDIHQLVPFTTSSEELIAGIDTIDRDISSDSSTNLHGAIIQGINKIEDLTGKENSKVSVGSLVIFTDGEDQADRRSEEDALNAVNNSDKDISIYTIGLGGEIDESTLKAFGRDDFVFADNIQELVPKFEDIANDIREDVRSYYLLEYCSPKRNGSHDLKISVTSNGLSGSITTCFCAEGFKGGCEISVEESEEI